MVNEILLLSYWGHFKKAKDIALIYPPEHHIRIELQEEIDKMILKINNYEL